MNETAKRTFRAKIVSCLTFNTTRRAVDLTFSVATKGNDVDPDMIIVCKRAAAFRRARARHREAKQLMKEIMGRYEEVGEPGIYREDEELSRKELAGEPTSPQRAKMRQTC